MLRQSPICTAVTQALEEGDGINETFIIFTVNGGMYSHRKRLKIRRLVHHGTFSQCLIMFPRRVWERQSSAETKQIASMLREDCNVVWSLVTISEYSTSSKLLSSDDLSADAVCLHVGISFSQSLPFGGCKASGYQRFGGPEGLRALCNIKAVTYDRFHGLLQTTIPPPLRFPILHAQKSWTFVCGLIDLMYSPEWKGKLGGIWKLIASG